ncbi:F420H(2)-dependent quinone reductase [Baekduia alba]|uniref:nitroreductase family deazaflavin-dependent oxidoreductase n=1 Tax=Baekduia alba TaxID=2997333 RepID=UPI0023420AD0|nr:nitroreductase family deazaflavin-dependent oxidoreductase [Baekduia alba]WCB92950.1 F420H(2)-dependent quinone reductase [Baekduia alba]
MLFGKEHIERYEATDGEEGHDWENTQTLILTTTGAKSGEERKAPLIYGEHDGTYLIVASKGGDPKPPAWYVNLQNDPQAEIQVWGEKFPVTARDATPEEKPELWTIMTGHWPAYDEYQTKTDREIPVVVLERA